MQKKNNIFMDISKDLKLDDFQYSKWLNRYYHSETE